MKQIAIIKNAEFYGYEDYHKIIDSISDWHEVEEHDLKLLYKYIKHLDINYHIIEKVDEDRVPLLVSACLAKAKQMEDAANKKKEERARKKKEREKTKLLEKEKTEKELFEKLQQKYGAV